MRNRNGTGALALFALLAVLGTVSAYGYGTSSISLASSAGSINKGAGTSVSYAVNLASGNTWGRISVW